MPDLFSSVVELDSVSIVLDIVTVAAAAGVSFSEELAAVTESSFIREATSSPSLKGVSKRSSR